MMECLLLFASTIICLLVPIQTSWPLIEYFTIDQNTLNSISSFSHSNGALVVNSMICYGTKSNDDFQHMPSSNVFQCIRSAEHMSIA